MNERATKKPKELIKWRKYRYFESTLNKSLTA
jgi:hypothetical protein